MRGRTIALATALAAVSTVALPITSAAAAGRLAAPTGAHVVRVTGTSFTVAASAAPAATGYRVFASTRRGDLSAARIAHARHSPVSRRPRMTVGRLRYTTAQYFYRVEARRGARHRLDRTIHAVWLRPGAPGGLRVTASGPTYLTWRRGAVTGYRVEQATNAAMTTGRRSYRLRAGVDQLSPYGLVAGRTYWFRLRAVNHETPSRYSRTVRARASMRQQGLTVMTYNVLEGTSAGQRESGSVIASWEQRRPGAVRLIQQTRPDVLAVQEAAAWVGPVHGFGGTRQVDDLARALGGGYALAETETPPWVHNFRRTANYLLYRRSAWTATATAGHWEVGDGHFAAYQVLRSRTTPARLLVVSTHLAVGNGAAADAVRQRETESLLRQARALAGPGHLPIVYAGDFNSDVNRNHAFDGPGRAMAATHAVDAEKVAQVLTNERYNSANLYLRTPPAMGQSIDYVYAAPGVAVRSRSVSLDLVHGRFAGVIPSDHNPVTARLYVPY